MSFNSSCPFARRALSREPLHALQAFVAVARTRNLTRAAAQMNLTVSALSHQMRALEQRLD